jgi:hypothetical protein
MSLDASIDQAAALEWRRELDHAIDKGPHPAAGEPAAERDWYGNLVLVTSSVLHDRSRTGFGLFRLRRMPKNNMSRSSRIRGHIRSGRSIDLRNERWLVLIEKHKNPFPRRHERMGEIRIPHISDHNQQRHPMLHDRRQFIGLVADASVMCDRDPATLADLFQPGLIGTVRREVVRMSFDMQTSGGQDFWKTLSEVAIGEEDAAHAARS